MKYFVDENSIVRQIWGKSDTILLIFAGASAEFALNKSVDWLYFTGRLPGDPIGRLFSTVTYARTIVFSEREVAIRAIDNLVKIHSTVEINRDQKIPDWAYRDVLYMLIDYSIRSFELLERKLTVEEKIEVFDVFYRLGVAMKLVGVPENYKEWISLRETQLNQNLIGSSFTRDLFKQYKRHLGFVRYHILCEVQKWIVPNRVRKLLNFRINYALLPLLDVYRIFKRIKIDRLVKSVIMPNAYRTQIESLDMPTRFLSPVN